MNTKLIPFDLDKAKNGAKVVTRRGYPVTIEGCYASKIYPIRATIKTEDGSFTYSFTAEGKLFADGDESKVDLFIEEEKEKPRREYSGTDSIYVPKDDEGIREELIDAINGLWDNDALPMPLSIKRKDAWLAWLEKQGVEKPADNKPKFHEGDWGVFNPGCNAHQIIRVVENVTSHTYGYDTVDGYYFNDTAEGVRLWNITDAKPGDVLASENGSDILIFKERDNRDGFSSYYNIQGKGELRWMDDCFAPATEEQCNLLFQKMKEAGYDWFPNIKEIHKIGKEEVKTRRMAHQELADWLRDAPEEHREYRYAGDKDVYNTYDYPETEAKTPVDENRITIRRNHGEWQEPLIEE